MKKKNKFLILILILAFAFIPNIVNARDYGYQIESYDVNMKVNEDNSFDITEKIDVNFNEARHGIIRKIPIRNSVKRNDGTYYNNKAIITNVSVNENYETSSDGSNYSIKIGDADNTITGLKEYTIKYHYSIIGNDKLKDKDELYYNIIGNSWDTEISNVTFTITMPKDFDSDSLGFSVGNYGISGYNTNYLSYDVNGKVIEGSYNNTLNEKEGITVRLELPEGYFVIPSKGGAYYLIIIIPIILVLISFILWLRYGKDDIVVSPVTFYPPDNVNSLEAGFLYKGNAESKDVTSLLVYLANKGYLTISEEKSKGILSSRNNFTLTKVKDYDGDNEYERTFFNGLFKNSTSVTMMDLYDNFYVTTNNILRNINTKSNKEKIFDKKSLTNRVIIYILIGIVYSIITLPPLFEFALDEAVIGYLFPLIGILVIVIFLSSANISSSKTVSIMFGLGFGFGPWSTIVLPVLTYDSFYLFAYLIGIVCIIIMFIFALIAEKRTKYGNDMLGKLRGFKNFLETAEKEKLESLVNEHPNYFYDILPYTYVLGVSSKWIKKFEDINMEAPTWYSGYDAFDYMRFSNSMDNLMTSSVSAMTSTPSSSSSSGGSGFSGGGFSGGGSGGGGGSSW